MTKEIGDKKLITTWAHDGTKIDPPSEKKETGWLLGEQPPREWMNFLQNESPKKLNYLLREGIPEWDHETPYVESNFVKHSDTVWKALATNTNSEPSFNNTDWQRYPDFSLNKWNVSVNYTPNDFVVHDFSIWRCVLGNTASEPEVGNTDWQQYPAFSINQWESTQEYFPDQLVFFSDLIFKSRTTNTNSIPIDNPDDWEIYPDFSLNSWDSGKTYAVNDFVFHEGTIYKCLVINNNSTPSLSNANWQRYPNFSLNEWDSETSYEIDQFVFFEGALYRALTANNNTEPDSNPSDWAIFSGTSEDTPNTLVERDSDGQAKFGTPTHEQHVIRAIDHYGPPTTLTASDLSNLGFVDFFELTPSMGQYIKLDFGSSGREPGGLGTSCPIGWTVTLEVVRTEPLTGTSISDSLGNSITFSHRSIGSVGGFGILDNTLYTWIDNGNIRRTYRAYPNASDSFSNAMCLKEVLTYQFVGDVGGQPTWMLRELPKSKRYTRGTHGGRDAHAELHPDGFVDFSQRYTPTTGSTARQDILFSMAHFAGGNWSGGFQPPMSSFMYLNQASGFAAAVKDEIRHMVWGWNVDIAGWSITPFVAIGGFRAYLFSAKGRWKPV